MLKKFVRRRISKVIIVVAVFGLLVFLNPYNFFNPFRSVFLKIIYPFEKVEYILSWKVSQVKDLIFSIGELKQENKRLSEENLKLLSENATLHDIESENIILRNELKLLPREDFDLEAAEIISYDPRGQGNWIKIDKGKKDGIKPGMPVIVSNSVMVGKIEEVFSRSSRVILIAGSQSAVNGVISATEAKGIVKGEYGLGIILDMVLQTDTINVGDEVITSGIGGTVPRGLLLGKIREVHPSTDRLFQQAVISPPIEFSKLRIVFVIKNANHEN